MDAPNLITTACHVTRVLLHLFQIRNGGATAPRIRTPIINHRYRQLHRIRIAGCTALMAPVNIFKFPISSPADTSPLEKLNRLGYDQSQILGVVGKTEGALLVLICPGTC
jgi:hypothetical protein